MAESGGGAAGAGPGGLQQGSPQPPPQPLPAAACVGSSDSVPPVPVSLAVPVASYAAVAESGRSAAAGSQQQQRERIALRKAQLRSYPRTKKLEKLGVYSACKAEESCKCNGWKNPNPPPTPPRISLQQTAVNLTEPCRSCGHTLADHVSHLENVSEEEMNRLLGIVLDVEYLFTCVHKEEDADTKQVYFYLFK